MKENKFGKSTKTSYGNQTTLLSIKNKLKLKVKWFKNGSKKEEKPVKLITLFIQFLLNLEYTHEANTQIFNLRIVLIF